MLYIDRDFSIISLRGNNDKSVQFYPINILPILSVQCISWLISLGKWNNSRISQKRCRWNRYRKSTFKKKKEIRLVSAGFTNFEIIKITNLFSAV